MEMVDWEHVRKSYMYNVEFNFNAEEFDYRSAALLQALNIEKMKYVELHEKGEISDKAATRLELLMSSLQVKLMSIIEKEKGSGVSAERLYQGIYNQILRLLLQDGVGHKWLYRLQDCWLTRWYAKPRIFDDLQLGYELGKAFIKAQGTLKHVLDEERRAAGIVPEAHHHQGVARPAARAKLQHAISEVSAASLAHLDKTSSVGAQSSVGAPSKVLTSRDSLEERLDLAALVEQEQVAAGLRPRGQGSAATDHTDDEVKHLDELEKAVAVRRRLSEKMDKVIRSMGKGQDVSQVVETRYAANLILHRQRRIVEEMQHHGELTEGDAADLIRDITTQLKLVHFSRPPLTSHF